MTFGHQYELLSSLNSYERAMSLRTRIQRQRLWVSGSGDSFVNELINQMID